MLRKCSLDQLRQTEGVEELHRKKIIGAIGVHLQSLQVWSLSSESRSIRERTPQGKREFMDDGMMTKRLLTKCQQKIPSHKARGEDEKGLTRNETSSEGKVRQVIP